MGPQINKAPRKTDKRNRQGNKAILKLTNSSYWSGFQIALL